MASESSTLVTRAEVLAALAAARAMSSPIFDRETNKVTRVDYLNRKEVPKLAVRKLIRALKPVVEATNGKLDDAQEACTFSTPDGARAIDSFAFNGLRRTILAEQVEKPHPGIPERLFGRRLLLEFPEDIIEGMGAFLIQDTEWDQLPEDPPANREQRRSQE